MRKIKEVKHLILRQKFYTYIKMSDYKTQLLEFREELANTTKKLRVEVEQAIANMKEQRVEMESMIKNMKNYKEAAELRRESYTIPKEVWEEIAARQANFAAANPEVARAAARSGPIPQMGRTGIIKYMTPGKHRKSKARKNRKARKSRKSTLRKSRKN